MRPSEFSRDRMTFAQVHLEMIAKGDHQYSSILTKKVLDAANMYPDMLVKVRLVNNDVALRYSYDPAEMPKSYWTDETTLEYVLIDENGLVPSPWSPELLDALRKLEEIEALPWLTNTD